MKNPDIKKKLHTLIEKIPETETKAAKRFLEFLIEKAQKEVKTQALIKAFEEAPECEEELTEEDLKELEESEQEAKEGKTTPWEQVKKELCS